MSNTSDKPSASSKPLNESYQGAIPKLNIRSDQGGIPLSQTGSHPRPQGSNTGITSEARPPKPTSLPK